MILSLGNREESVRWLRATLSVPAFPADTRGVQPRRRGLRAPIDLHLGTGSADRGGELVGSGDFEAQTRQVFDNLTAALAAADASWADVVKLNYFLTDVSQIASVRAIRDEYVNTEQPPASTLVEVSSLFRNDVLIEIDAVAIAD